ncbi:hypothetical protein [Streptacidiphilus sp. P02-A3a]|uniref:hypothetical protein n=1 Tax=Streptacidiphilus sp. P02-A3a TaxID=2704468 RepID=UPI001CDB657D|nr:hypothetical protein [Streptacidiphilus sp. P02-A3a]
MVRLGRGATGFRGAKDDPLPEADLQAFRAAWHAAARLADGQAGELVRQAYPRSFHTATVADRNGTHVVLCHAHLPLVAFAADQWRGHTVEFRDPPIWSNIFTDAGFMVMSERLLNSPLSQVDTSDLCSAEWIQIRYWRANRLGEVLFNSWD